MKRLFILLFIILLLPWALQARKQGQPLIDSLLKELNSNTYQNKDDTNKANLLNYIASAYQGINAGEAINFSHKAMDISTRLAFKKGIARAYCNISIYLWKTGNFSEAMKNSFTALKLYDEIGDLIGMASCYINIGEMYSDQDNYPDALKNELEALKIAQKLGNKTVIASAYDIISANYIKQRKYTDALQYALDGLIIYEETGDTYGIGSVKSNIGTIYFEQKNYPDALKYLLATLEIYQKSHSNSGTEQTLIKIAWVYDMQKKYTKAQQYCKKGIAIAHAIDALGDIRLGNELLSDIYAHTGRYQQSLATYKEFILEHDSIFNALNTQKIVEQQMEFEYDKKEALTRLEQGKKDEIVGEKLKQEKNMDAISLAGSGLLLIVALISLFAYRQKKKDNFIISKEKQRSEELLLNILPTEVAEELKTKGSAEARFFDNVTVVFTDFVGFTQAGERMTPQELIRELDTCFKTFDFIMTKYHVEKIKTIGDAYLAVAGLPKADTAHALKALKAAKEICDFMAGRVAKLGDKTFEVRIGVHSGNVVAGIVGVKKYAYDIWGDTVNTAARMEQNSEPGKINISGATYALVKDKFNCIYRGEIEVKNKDKMSMYFVEGII